MVFLSGWGWHVASCLGDNVVLPGQKSLSNPKFVSLSSFADIVLPEVGLRLRNCMYLRCVCLQQKGSKLYAEACDW